MTERLGSFCSSAYGAFVRMGKAAVVVMALAAPAVAEEVTIVALGDSLTQGYGLVEEDGFVPQLEAWLRARGADVVVQNHGVSGDTTAGGLARIGWALEGDVDALIVALGGNDLLRGLPPEASRANLDGILAEADARGLPVLLIGLEAPGNYGPEYKAAFDGMYPDLAAEYDALLVDSFLAPLSEAAESDRAGALARYMQPDGIHPNAEGVALIVEALGPEVEALIARIDPAS
jgi:acyl-CoA thioesterase-1